MAINKTPIYGTLDRALSVHAERMRVLGGNLANSDTPGFKAQDIDFRRVLNQSQEAQGLKATHANHFSGTGSAAPTPRVWRVPSQPSADGNTVDVAMEQARFSEASLRYEATLRFIDGRVKGLKTAISGQ